MLNIVCMLMGKGIPDIYVTRLYSMLKRHVQVPFRLHCITDRPRALPDDICIIDASSWIDMLREGMRITTNKIRLFDPKWLPFEEFLYLDVTLVIKQDMQPLLDHCLNDPHDLVIVRDWNYGNYNSCAMRIRQSPQLHQVYRSFREGKVYKQKVPGDQDFLYACIQDLGLQDRVGFFEPDHVVSYKKLRFQNRVDSTAAYEAINRGIIVKFHGQDKMHLILNPLHNFFVIRLRKRGYGLKDGSFWINELREHWR